MIEYLEMIDKLNKTLVTKKDKVAPIETLKKIDGGRSGAGVYMVEYGEDNKVGILKISHDKEAEVFQKAYELASKNNMHKYIAKLIANYEFKLTSTKKLLYFNLYDLAGDDIYSVENILCVGSFLQ